MNRDEDDDEEDATMANDDELYAWEAKPLEHEEKEEIVIDDERYHNGMTVKQLKAACEKHQLATSGSRRKLLNRLGVYKLGMQMLMESQLARKMYEKEKRRRVQIKAPRLPSQQEQDEHNLIDWPFALWCDACWATRSKENVHSVQQHEHGKPIIQLDYCYTFTDEHGEQQIWDPNGPTKFPQDQYGTMLGAAASETKAILGIPVLTRGTVSLKMVTEELVRFGLTTAKEVKSSTKQMVKEVAHRC